MLTRYIRRLITLPLTTSSIVGEWIFQSHAWGVLGVGISGDSLDWNVVYGQHV